MRPEAYIEAEKRLAELLGWKNLFAAGGTLLGTPPVGGVRGQAAVPRWTRDWSACGPLLVEYNAGFSLGDTYLAVDTCDGPVRCVDYDDHPSKQVAVLYAIVLAVTSKLEERAD